MQINTDQLVEILKKDKPLSGWMAQEDGKDKIFFLAVLPHLADKVADFANKLLKDEGY